MDTSTILTMLLIVSVPLLLLCGFAAVVAFVISRLRLVIKDLENDRRY